MCDDTQLTWTRIVIIHIYRYMCMYRRQDYYKHFVDFPIKNFVLLLIDNFYIFNRDLLLYHV